MPLPPLLPVRRVRIVHEDETQRKLLVRGAMVAVAERCAWSGAGLGTDLGEGRGRRDKARVALFKTITEGRGMSRKYSTCGELVGFCLASLGLRDERILNKDDDDLDGVADAKQRRGLDSPGIAGQHAWKVGQVITMLVEGSRQAGCWVSASAIPGRLPRAGDCALVGENGQEHVFVITSDLCVVSENRWVFRSVDAGQVDAGGQCTKAFAENYLSKQGARWVHTRGTSEGWQHVVREKSSRPLIGWIDLDKVPLPGPALLPASFTEGCEPWQPLGGLLARTRARSTGSAGRRSTCVARPRCSSPGSRACGPPTSRRAYRKSRRPASWSPQTPATTGATLLTAARTEG